MKVIGLTGGIASGKSTVSAYLKQKGIPIIDCDVEARHVFDVGQKAYYDVIAEFGDEILNDDKTINRKKLASIVYPDKEKVKRLNEINHPSVIERTYELLDVYRDAGIDIAVIDAPLLIEAGMNKMADEVWVVYTDIEVQIKRAMARDNSTYESVADRMKNQVSAEEKIKYADKLINNNGTREELYRQIDKLLAEMGKG